MWGRSTKQRRAAERRRLRERVRAFLRKDDVRAKLQRIIDVNPIHVDGSYQWELELRMAARFPWGY